MAGERPPEPPGCISLIKRRSGIRLLANGRGTPQRMVLLACLLPVLLVGCKSIRSIRGVPVDTTRPLTLTATEARALGEQAWEAYLEQPRTVARVEAAAQRLDRCARALPQDYQLQVRAATALAFVAANDSRPRLREQTAKRGVVLSRYAMELDPGRGAAYYWYALNVGLVADLDRAYGLDAVSEMETALRRAIELDAAYDHGGPLRLLAILHLRTPPPPVAIGSNRKALRLLQRAIAQEPEYPENYLYLAETQHAAGRFEEARETLQRVLDAAPVNGLEFESEQWRQAAQELERQWATNN